MSEYKPLLSIIVPVYNTESYLAECLDSLCNQTLRDIEIICVNDGSTDGSLEILRKYEQKDQRITVVDQKNQGVSVARNNGVAKARGKYIFFMDSDDLADVRLAEYGVGFAEENQCEVINIRTLDDCLLGVDMPRIPYVKRLANQICFQDIRVYHNISSQQREFLQYVSGGAPYNIVLKESWQKYEISFPANIAINEDFFVWFLLYSQMKSIGFLFPENRLFIRRWNPTSSTRIKIKRVKNKASKQWDQFRVFELLQKRFIETGQFDSHRTLAVRYLTSLPNMLFTLPRNERRRFKIEADKIWNERIAAIVADPNILLLQTRLFWLGLYGDCLTNKIGGLFVMMRQHMRFGIKRLLKFAINIVPSRYVTYLPLKLQRLHRNAPMSFYQY